MALIAIAAVGAVLIMAASPPVAERIGLDPFHFVRRQFVFLPAAITVMLATSLLAPRGIRRLALVCFVAAIGLMALTLLVGEEIKGATRWIRIGGFSLQASELVKPAFAVLAAGILADRRLAGRGAGYLWVTGLFLLVAGVAGRAAGRRHDHGRRRGVGGCSSSSPVCH